MQNHLRSPMMTVADDTAAMLDDAMRHTGLLN